MTVTWSKQKAHRFADSIGHHNRAASFCLVSLEWNSYLHRDSRTHPHKHTYYHHTPTKYRKRAGTLVCEKLGTHNKLNWVGIVNKKELLKKEQHYIDIKLLQQYVAFNNSQHPHQRQTDTHTHTIHCTSMYNYSISYSTQPQPRTHTNNCFGNSKLRVFINVRQVLA